MIRRFTFHKVDLGHWDIEEALGMAWELWVLYPTLRYALNYEWEDFGL